MEKQLKKLQKLGVNIEDKYLEGESPILFENIWIKEGEENPNFESLSFKYLSFMKGYVSALTDRAFIEQYAYEKLIMDLLVLGEQGYRIQRKGHCTYLDIKKGFVFVKPYKTKSISDVELIQDAFFTLFGNGLPEYYVGFLSHNLVTKDLQDSLQNCTHICSLRLMNYLVEKGFSYKVVEETVADCLIEIERKFHVINEDDFSLTMQRFYLSSKEQLYLKMENDKS